MREKKSPVKGIIKERNHPGIGIIQGEKSSRERIRPGKV